MRSTRRLEALVLLIPGLIAASFIAAYAVDTPFWDEWDLTEILLKAKAGTATLSDYLEPHSENRMFFPKLILARLAIASGWSSLVEIWANYALLVATWLLLLAIVRATPIESGRRRFAAAAVASCSIFSLVQWENLIWGWQLSYYLANLAFVLAVAILIVPERLPLAVRAVLAAICCSIASFSIAYGLLSWAAVYPSLFAAARTRRARAVSTLCWGLAALLVVAVYFEDFSPVPHTPPTIEAVLLALGIAGSPLLRVHPANIAAGLVLLVAFIPPLVELARGRLHRASGAWLSLGAFSILFAAAAAHGRSYHGVAYAVTSRYTTVTLFLPLAVVLLALPDLRLAREEPVPDRRDARARYYWIAVALLVGSTVASDSIAPLTGRSVRDERRELRLCKAIVLAVPGADSHCYPLFHPVRTSFPGRAEQLRESGFPGFRTADELNVSNASWMAGGLSGARILNDGSARVGGWLQGTDEGEPRIIALSRLGGEPVGVTFLDAAVTATGERILWTVDVPSQHLHPGEPLQAWTMSWDEEIHRLPGTIAVPATTR